MASATHLVLIPSYNSGARLAETACEALAHWSPVWIVIDGSTDGSAAAAQAMARNDPRLRVIVRDRRGGKGAAVASGVAAARAAGFSHALILDADGQHPADRIPEFMATSAASPAALILGRPIFGKDAPFARLQGRKLSIAMARVQILGRGIDDPLFGFRVYPLDGLARAFAATRFGRGYDFDHEMAVRLRWQGAPTINLAAPCRYLPKNEGGISHFRYIGDNLILIAMNLRLLLELPYWHAQAWLARGGRAPRPRAFGLALGFGALLAAAAPGGRERPILSPATDPAWQDLLPGLAAMGDRSCEFLERRTFPFRSVPLRLQGQLRFSAKRGLSLQYRAPEARIVIVDRAGIVLRESGRSRSMSAAEPGAGPLAALFPVLEFDLAELPELFEMRGRRSGADWTLDLTPRSPTLAARLKSVRLAGHGPVLRQVRLDLGEGEHIELELSAIRPHVVFSPEEISRYFR